MNKTDIYKRTQKRIKWLGICTPIVFWLCLALSVLCFCFAVKNSLGNVGEILDMLDSSTHTGEQLEQNYALLVDKYGELTIGNGGNMFTISFINLKKAVFGGFMVTNAVFCVVFLVSAFVLGKWLLPALKKRMENENQDMVNLTILENK